MALAESDTIARYLLDTYTSIGPDFQLHSNPKSNYLARLHDMYLTTIQGCMYKATGPFGSFGSSRQEALAEYIRQWQIIDDLIDANKHDKEGLYLLGPNVSLADATIFPSAVFAKFMLPKFNVTPALPPKIDAWFERVRTQDDAFAKVYDEIHSALLQWDANGRWESIR